MNFIAFKLERLLHVVYNPKSAEVLPLDRGRRIMLENLPIMLCCTAPKMYLLCSLNYQQNSIPDYLTRKLTRSLRAFLIVLTELASYQCLAVCLL